MSANNGAVLVLVFITAARLRIDFSSITVSAISRGSRTDVVHQNEVGTRPCGGVAIAQSFSGKQTFAGAVINRNIYQGSAADMNTLQSFSGSPQFTKTVTNINTVRLAKSTADANKPTAKSGVPAAPVQIFADRPSFQAPVVNTNTMDSDISSSNTRSVPMQSYKGQPAFRDTVTNTNTLNLTGDSHNISRVVSRGEARPLLDDGIRVSAVQVRRSNDDGIRVSAQRWDNDDGIRVSPLQSFDEEPAFHGAVHSKNSINLHSPTSHYASLRSGEPLLQKFSGREHFLRPATSSNTVN